MKKLLIAALIITTAGYLLISSLSSNMQINKYANREAVIEQKAIASGYIPGILPDSAYDIAEMHSEGSADFYGAFSYKEVDEPALLSQLSDTGDANHTMVWEGFLFLIDREKNRVKFRNRVQ